MNLLIVFSCLFNLFSSKIELIFNSNKEEDNIAIAKIEFDNIENFDLFIYENENINLNKIGILPMYGNIYKNYTGSLEIENILNKLNFLKYNFLFYPAQFWAHKNHYNLLLALHKLNNEGNDYKIVFTGSDKGNLNYVKNLVVELELENNVLFLGFISNDEIQYLYKNAFALIMPTFLGPTNMPIIEAMQNNCLVICSNLDGHIEQTNGHAYYFKPQNYNDIASKIKLAFTDSNIIKDQMVNNAYQYSKSITIENTCNKLNDYLDNFQSIRYCWPNTNRN